MATILVVEDDPHQRLLYRLELGDDGYRVIAANNGREALAQVKEHSPDLVILDLQLPGMDGIDVLWRLLGYDAELPVIIHSAHGYIQDNYMTWIASAFVVKSSNLDPLKQAICKVLSEQMGKGQGVPMYQQRA